LPRFATEGIKLKETRLLDKSCEYDLPYRPVFLTLLNMAEIQVQPIT